MRYPIVWTLILLGTVAAGPLVVAPSNAGRYRIGKAPRAEFRVEGQSFKLDPNVAHVQRVRALAPGEFDPIRRRERVPEFYRDKLKDLYDDCMRGPHHHCGPFRWEFVYWTTRWQMELRARWAWNHRRYIEEVLWARWMQEAQFAAEIRLLEAQHAPVQDGYLPAEYAGTSPLVMYVDEYLDAAYNPVPFLAVMNLTSLKPDPQADWIGKAAAQSFTTKISALPGMFVVEQERTARAMGMDRRLASMDETARAAQVGKSLDVQEVVVGNYVADGDKVLFNLRIVEVQSGKVLTGISQAVPRDHLLDVLPEFAVTLANSLNPQPAAPPPAVASTNTDPPVRRHIARTPKPGSALPEGAVETEMVGGHGGNAFVHVDPSSAGGPVLGFRYSMGHWSGRDVLRTLDPLFSASDAAEMDPRTMTVMARDGYVVGGLMLDTDELNAVAVRVLFLKLKDGHPDLTDHYTSPWIGVPSGISTKYLAGHGERVLGTFGHKGLNLDAVGLVLEAPPATDLQQPKPGG